MINICECEVAFLMVCPIVILIGIILSLILFFIKKTHPWGKKIAIFSLVLIAIYGVVFFGGDIVREIFAKSVIKSAQPLINTVEQYKKENGRYPSELKLLIPRYIHAIPNPKILRARGINYPPFIYQLEDESYSLRFWLPGPPFGHHFIYTPSKEYPEWWNVLVFKKKRELKGWGWYLKF